MAKKRRPNTSSPKSQPASAEAPPLSEGDARPAAAAPRAVRKRREAAGMEEPAVGWKAEWALLRRLGAEAASAWKLLLGVWIAAILARLFQLGEAGLWLDEVTVLNDAVAGTNVIVSSAHDMHLAMVRFFTSLFGENGFGLRFWSALSGSFAAPALALAGLWLGHGMGRGAEDNGAAARGLGLVAGALGALSPYLIYFSQDGNYYGAMAMIAAMQVAVYVALFRGAPLGGLTALFLLSLLAYLNHPFGVVFSAIALGGGVLGVSIYPSLRRTAISFYPGHWAQRPAVPILILASIFVFPKLKPIFAALGQRSQELIDVGQTFNNIAFGLPFFRWVYTSFGVTFYRPGVVAELAAWVVFGFAVAGVVLLARRALASDRMAQALAGLALLAPVLSFALIFSISIDKGFYLRYLTSLVPVYLLTVALGLLALGRWAASLRRESPSRAAGYALAVAAVLILPFLLKYYAADLSNNRGMAEELVRLRSGGQPIFQLAKIDTHHNEYALSQTEPPLWPEIENLRADHRFPNMAASHMIHRLLGVPDAFAYTTFREADHAAITNWMIDSIPVAYHGTSKKGPQEDAYLLHWRYGGRLLLPGAATRFEAGPENALFAAGEGRWRLSPQDAPDRTLATLESEGIARIGLSDNGLKANAALQATPLFPERFVLPPTAVVDYVDDPRIYEESWPEDAPEGEGIPVVRRRFMGGFSHLLWSPAGERRQLVPRVIRSADQDLFLEIAVDGVHRGVWRVEKGAPELVRVPLGVDLAPGNHRVSIHGFSPTMGGSGLEWRWAGLEWNTERTEPQAPIGTSEELFVAFPEPVLSWAGDAEGGLRRGLLEQSPSYTRRIGANGPGPSGQQPLVFDLDAPAKNPRGYHFLFAPPVPTGGKPLIGFSTYLKMEGSQSHDAALAVAFFNSQGQMIGSKIGSQQKLDLINEAGTQWVRFVEITGLPPQAAAAAPGVIVFPPDPSKADPKGTIAFDALAGLAQGEDLAGDPWLPESLFWTVAEDRPSTGG
ncbi:MAG: hypothetical protein RLY93_00875 [Sumerlaeia bacterium]